MAVRWMKPIVIKEIKNGCWVCISRDSQYENGRPIMHIDGKSVPMSHYIYREFVTPMRKGTVIMHKCDNPSCINPSHLEQGAQRDNINDAIKKGRFTGRRSKLTPKQIIEIFRDRKSSCDLLGEKYGVSRSTISLIRLGKVSAKITLNDKESRGERL